MMPAAQILAMRATLTLDEDIAANLRAESRRAGKPFREVVNETLRRGLVSQHPETGRKPFRVVTRDLGNTSPGLSMDDVAGLIEHVEGPLRGDSHGRQPAPLCV
jgi:hypothetical protein